MLVRLINQAVVATGVLLLAGCGDSETKTVTVTKTVTNTAKPTILDTEKVERAIERSGLDQRGVRATVSCPSGIVQRRGNTFRCRARKRDGTGPVTNFTVRQKDNRGNVTYAAP